MNENKQNLNENKQNFNENKQNLNENIQNLNKNNNQNENNQNLNENEIKNKIKESLEKYSNKLIEENKGECLSNIFFNGIKIIENKEDENKKIIYKNNKNKLIINIIFESKLKIEGNYKWKFIPIKNYKLEDKIIEKYSLNFVEKNSVVNINEDNSIKFKFDLKDNKKKFLIFAIGLYNKQFLIIDTIILFIINLENFMD